MLWIGRRALVFMEGSSGHVETAACFLYAVLRLCSLAFMFYHCWNKVWEPKGKGRIYDDGNCEGYSVYLTRFCQC